MLAWLQWPNRLTPVRIIGDVLQLFDCATVVVIVNQPHKLLELLMRFRLRQKIAIAKVYAEDGDCGNEQ